MILLTTSRRPTNLLRAFCRDLANSIPYLLRVNRGKMSIDDLTTRAIEFEADRIILVDRWSRGFGKISFFFVGSNGLNFFPPMMFISEINLRQEFNEGRRRFHSSVITIKREDSKELKRIGDQLSSFFKLPISVDKVSKKHDTSIHLAFNSSKKLQFKFLKGMVEIGPRVTFSEIVWEDL